jgi:acetoin utilization protein AcuC
MYQMTTAFVYSEKFQGYDYGPSHPLKMLRLKLTHELLKSCGVFGAETVNEIAAEPCTREEAQWVHSAEYLDVLQGIDEGRPPDNPAYWGLGYGDNPAFKGVYAGSMLSTGASLQAARAVQQGKADAAFNISGGLHHAMPNRASGFCYINDPAVAIMYLVKQGLKVAYVDIDAHHGDGVQHVFYETDKVLTVSLHESGRYLFPGTGFPEDSGSGKGRGYSVNLPLAPETGDEVFIWAFNQLVPPLIEKFNPDVLVTQLGADTMDTDPLTHYLLSTNGFEAAVKAYKKMNRPWIALGGGGYDVAKTARCWALAFGIMSGINLPNELPADYKALLKEHGIPGNFLRDKGPTEQTSSDLKRQRQAAEEMLIKLRKEIPLLH